MSGGLIGGPTAPAGRLTFSVEEAADVLGIGLTMAKQLIRTGELRSIKIGRRRLVAWADLEAFVERCRDAA